MIFVNKGDAPLTPAQLEKRSQRWINRSWTPQAREESIRKADGAFDAFMTMHSTDHATNKANNEFNQQLADYRVATARLAQHILADGRAEVREMQPTGEQVFNEESGEMEDVMHEVITVTAIDPVEPTVTRMLYSKTDPDAEPTEETIENPLITQDNEERAEAQAVVDATPQEVKDAAQKPEEANQ